jgi:hypothetical protein
MRQVPPSRKKKLGSEAKIFCHGFDAILANARGRNERCDESAPEKLLQELFRL